MEPRLPSSGLAPAPERQPAWQPGQQFHQQRRRLAASAWWMARLGLVLVGTLAFALTAAPAPAAHAESCTYVLGFKSLHDQIPDIVGECRTGETHNPANGDGIQMTGGGMLVWRKSDNFTAFTDGYRTWVNGPAGLRKRLNTERFAWESDAPTTAPASGDCVSLAESQVKGPDVDVVSWRLEQRATGSLVVGQVRNNCAAPRQVSLEAILTDATGQPVAITDAGSWALGPRETGGFALAAGPLTDAALTATFHPKSADTTTAAAPECLDVGTSRCLKTDVWLESSLTELRRTDAGSWLVRVAAENGVSLGRANLPAGALAQYSHTERSIRVDVELDGHNGWEKAAVLAHELQHAADDAAGKLGGPGAPCYKNEEDGFRRGAEVWSALWHGKLPQARNSVQAELNDVVDLLAHNPVEFVRQLRQVYKQECTGVS